MWSLLSLSTIGLLTVAVVPTLAATCPDSVRPKYAFPSLAPGYSAQLVATGLTKPRSIVFDKNGHLLVVQQGDGIVNIKFSDNNGCVSSNQVSRVVNNQALNHGLALSKDGQTLFASSTEAAYSWPFDPISGNVAGKNTTIVTGMSNGDHTTRTLLLSEKENTTLLISRGSDSNIDLKTLDIASGHSQIKAFQVDRTGGKPFDYSRDGKLIGWGLRNSVGLAEEPLTGGIYSVENSADDIEREGKDIHSDNPGEEMNFHGYLNGTQVKEQGGNYGYPTCFAAWNLDDLPNKGSLKVGSQFVSGTPNSTVNDTFCASERIPPRLTFQAHMAPLDMKFNASGIEAWITFHGSWDRTQPVGYKLSLVTFSQGSPVAASDNKTAAVDIMTNVDNSKCPDGCFRPVGLALDSQGRLFMSSDATGEIYMIQKGTPSTSATGTSTSTTGASASSTSQPSAAHRIMSDSLGFLWMLSFVYYFLS